MSLTSKTKGNYSLSTVPYLKTWRPDVFQDSEFFPDFRKVTGVYIFYYVPPPTGVGAVPLIKRTDISDAKQIDKDQVGKIRMRPSFLWEEIRLGLAAK